MTNISNEVISIDEAKAALKCMRLSGLGEDESIESVDSLIHRIRKIGTAELIEDIIENQLTDLQREITKEYWYMRKNTSQIARDNNLSQAAVYKALTRANDTIKRLMSPVIQYHNGLTQVALVPIQLNGLLEICAARNSNSNSFCEKLRDYRVSYAITAEQLASALKISQHELENIESGRQIPSVTTMLRYSSLFDLEIKMEIINGKGEYTCKKLYRN